MELRHSSERSIARFDKVRSLAAVVALVAGATAAQAMRTPSIINTGVLSQAAASSALTIQPCNNRAGDNLYREFRARADSYEQAYAKELNAMIREYRAYRLVTCEQAQAEADRVVERMVVRREAYKGWVRDAAKKTFAKLQQSHACPEWTDRVRAERRKSIGTLNRYAREGQGFIQSELLRRGCGVTQAMRSFSDGAADLE